nr:Gfo/Idh/MocA family oxidoreductase [Pyrinomonadaceae bacterium]
MTDKIERREFVKWEAASAVGASITLKEALAQTASANDRIVLGIIGTGRQGQGNMKSMLKQMDASVAAICDVYAPNLEKAAAIAPNAEKYKDFRKILDRKDINAVVISTPDHWHALQTVMA